MTDAFVKLPLSEIEKRHNVIRRLLASELPSAGGLLVFSPINIYYLSGSLASGVLWLPLEGEPVLMVRKGLERAQQESSLKGIFSFRSFSSITSICEEAGSPLSPVAGAEKGGLSWNMAEMLMQRMPSVRLLDAGNVLARARSVKTAYELEKLRKAGMAHQASYIDIYRRLAPGMSERDISIRIWESFFAHGHAGQLRVSALEGEVFLGTIAAGDNANYPSFWDGPVGYRGGHTATPVMGHEFSIWQPETPLIIDAGFSYQGYHTDKTQVFWSGAAASIPAKVQHAHELCIEIQDATAAAMKPGTSPEYLWQMALKKVKQAGFEEFFMGFGDNQVHFLGHGIGLAYDEYPAIAKGFVEPLQEHMVLAVEPKIAFPGLGMVGLENVFAVTSTGGVSLTGPSEPILTVC